MPVMIVTGRIDERFICTGCSILIQGARFQILRPDSILEVLHILKCSTIKAQSVRYFPTRWEVQYGAGKRGHILHSFHPYGGNQEGGRCEWWGGDTKLMAVV